MCVISKNYYAFRIIQNACSQGVSYYIFLSIAYIVMSLTVSKMHLKNFSNKHHPLNGILQCLSDIHKYIVGNSLPI